MLRIAFAAALLTMVGLSSGCSSGRQNDPPSSQDALTAEDCHSFTPNTTASDGSTFRMCELSESYWYLECADGRTGYSHDYYDAISFCDPPPPPPAPTPDELPIDCPLTGYTECFSNGPADRSGGICQYTCRYPSGRTKKLNRGGWCNGGPDGYSSMPGCDPELSWGP